MVCGMAVDNRCRNRPRETLWMKPFGEETAFAYRQRFSDGSQECSRSRRR